MLFNNESLREQLAEYIFQARARGNAEQFVGNLGGLISQLSAHAAATEEDSTVLAQIELAKDYMEYTPPWWKEAERCVQKALDVLPSEAESRNQREK
jgi:hypothetical protein